MKYLLLLILIGCAKETPECINGELHWKQLKGDIVRDNFHRLCYEN